MEGDGDSLERDQRRRWKGVDAVVGVLARRRAS